MGNKLCGDQSIGTIRDKYGMPTGTQSGDDSGDLNLSRGDSATPSQISTIDPGH